jgi:hypothetical protein
MDELERISKEADGVLSRYYPVICLEELRSATKTPVRIAGVLGEIRTELL